MKQPALAQITERPAEDSRPPVGLVKPLSADRFSVSFTADKAFRELLEEVRALLSHTQPKGDVRDQGRCTFCADDGRRCGERRLLQLDHVIPHAQGGEPTVANLRLRCRAHNLHTARAHFGRDYVRAAAERARERPRRAGFDAQ